MALARIGIGSNIGDAGSNVRDAIERLAALGTVVARSSLYCTKAWGVTDQPDFVNAAALVETEFGPRELLNQLKLLETDLGRTQTFRWGPRVIDLDILAYDAIELDEPDLIIPHARLRERAFALIPLAEIDSAFAPLLAGLDPALLAEVQRLHEA